MAIEDTIVKFSDQIAKAVSEGTVSYSGELKDPRFKIENENIKLYAYARAFGKLEKVAEAVPTLSKDRQKVTYTGAQFERNTNRAIEIVAVFGKPEAGWYALGSVPVPEEISDPAKYGEKIDKKISAGLQKAGIIL